MTSFRLTLSLCALLAAITGALGIVAFMSHFRSEDLVRQIKLERRSYLSASLFVYGTIISTNADRVVTFQTENPYGTSAGKRTISLPLSPNARISRQYLKQSGSNGTYDTLSPLTAVSFEDIQAGERAAMLIGRDGPADPILIYVITVGNPL